MSTPSTKAYAAPADSTTSASPRALEDPFEATKPTTKVIAAAACVAINGVVVALAALKLWLYVRLQSSGMVLAYVMVATGAVFVGIAVKLYRQRLWASYAGIGLAGLGALAALVWFLLTFGSGIFTLYALMLPPLGVAGVVLGILAHPQVQRATAAREQLAKDGVLADF